VAFDIDIYPGWIFCWDRRFSILSSKLGMGIFLVISKFLPGTKNQSSRLLNNFPCFGDVIVSKQHVAFASETIHWAGRWDIMFMDGFRVFIFSALIGTICESCLYCIVYLPDSSNGMVTIVAG